MAVNFEITEHLAVLSEGNNGWRMELNMVSWNGRDPKLDIRNWDSEHEKMSKGVTLTSEEAERLHVALGVVGVWGGK